MALDVRSIDPETLERLAAPAGRQELRVFLAEEAFDGIVAQANESPGREVGGVLVGRTARDEAGPYVKVDAVVAARLADGKDAELTFTHAAWAAIHEELDRQHAGERIVGWYHTHPGFGVFLSDRDEFIHQSFFDLPFQIALVYDTASREHGVFLWRGGRPWRARQYWIGTREVSWDGPREGPVQERQQVRAAAESEASTPPPRPSTAPPGPDGETVGPVPLPWLLVAGVVAILAAGFLGWQIGAGSSSEREQALRTEVSRARAEGAKEAIEGLDADLLLMLRRALGQTESSSLDEAAGGLERALAAGTDGGAEAAPVREAFARLHRALDERRAAARTLEALEKTIREGRLGSVRLARAVDGLGSVVGVLCAERAAEAARAGDHARARAWLEAAAQIDPENLPRYEAQLQGSAPGASLGVRAAEAGGVPAAPAGADAGAEAANDGEGGGR
ncbi:MAG: Mov34/MPN/PAD-1 family protein [Deltaproteobacteria bacterium]|nr:Mov34/MPN/PAD-1 family protein [Deltaproteobacteria bacterium]